MDADEKRAEEMFQSVTKQQASNERDSKLTTAEISEHEQMINLMASKSKRKFGQLGQDQAEAKPVVEVQDEPEANPTFSDFVGKTFVRRVPGVYVGAKYLVKQLMEDQFLVARDDPAHGIFEFTMKCRLFHQIMKLPDPPKPPPKEPEPEPEKPASPWAKKKK